MTDGPGTGPGRTRVFELDILRGFAILLVLGFHNPSLPGESGVLRPVEGVFHAIGWSGVDLFFVLSGFLIGGLLFAEIERSGRLNAKRFLTRRMLRIWPAYYCLLLVAFARLVIQTHGDWTASVGAMWPGFTNIENFIQVPRPQLWSLAIEEHFYVLLPLLLIVLLRLRSSNRGIRLIPHICIGLVFGCLALRGLLVLTTHVDVRRQTYLCIDALFFGVTLAYIRSHRPELVARVSRNRWLMPLALMMFVPALVGGTIRDTIGYSSLYIGYALILIRFVYRGERSAVLNRFVVSRSAGLIAWIGTYSYAIYLWHYDTGWWGYVYGENVGTALGLPGAVVWLCHTALWFTVSIFSAVLLTRLIEAPVMRLRERFFPAAANGPNATARNASAVDPVTATAVA
jgi:peptidoglycan/LPS O-acetylase OafA/YrhL